MNLISIILKISITFLIAKVLIKIIRKLGFKTNISSYIKGKLGEMKVRSILKDVKEKYKNSYLINDVLYGNSQIDHILLINNIALVVETKNIKGEISGTTTLNKVSVRKPFSFDTYTMYNPILQNKGHVEEFKRQLRKSTGSEYEVLNIVYFVNKRKRKIKIESNEKENIFIVNSRKDIIKILKKKVKDINKTKYDNKKLGKYLKSVGKYSRKEIKEHNRRIQELYC